MPRRSQTRSYSQVRRSLEKQPRARALVRQGAIVHATVQALPGLFARKKGTTKTRCWCFCCCSCIVVVAAVFINSRRAKADDVTRPGRSSAEFLFASSSRAVLLKSAWRSFRGRPPAQKNPAQSGRLVRPRLPLCHQGPRSRPRAGSASKVACPRHRETRRSLTHRRKTARRGRHGEARPEREGRWCTLLPRPGLQPRRSLNIVPKVSGLHHWHQWSSGRIHRCYRCDPGSIPG